MGDVMPVHYGKMPGQLQRPGPSRGVTAVPNGTGQPGVSFGRVFRRYFPVFLIVWILLVLYPNPARLFISVHRVFHVAADPVAVEPLLDDFPSDGEAIEVAVLQAIPYRYDWQLHGMPWYFPTIHEVLRNGEGDCKARALVLASVLEGKGIPYWVNVSPIHVWVDYEGKEESSIENARVKFYQEDPETGRRWFQLPDVDVREVLDSMWQAFWIPMPGGRKAILLSGIVVLTAARVLFRKRSPEVGRPVVMETLAQDMMR